LIITHLRHGYVHLFPQPGSIALIPGKGRKEASHQIGNQNDIPLLLPWDAYDQSYKLTQDTHLSIQRTNHMNSYKCDDDAGSRVYRSSLDSSHERLGAYRAHKRVMVSELPQAGLVDCVAAGQDVDRLDRVKEELEAHGAVLFNGMPRHVEVLDHALEQEDGVQLIYSFGLA